MVLYSSTDTIQIIRVESIHDNNYNIIIIDIDINIPGYVRLLLNKKLQYRTMQLSTAVLLEY